MAIDTFPEKFLFLRSECMIKKLGGPFWTKTVIRFGLLDINGAKTYCQVFIIIVYIYMSNSISFRQILSGLVLESPQILVCCSTWKVESSYKISAPGVQPFARNPLWKVRKMPFFTHFQKFISRLLINQFQFSHRNFVGFFSKF